MNKSIQNKQFGITLLEIIIVIAIIGILSAIIIPNYKDAQASFALERSAHKLSQDIRRAAEMALAAEECCGGIIPPRYGIYISMSELVLFADTKPPKGIYSDQDDIIDTLDLEDKVFIKDINVGSPPKTSITFEPPAPTVAIKWDNESDPGADVIITLARSDSSETKKVIVSRSGLVSVE